jgi:ferric-dicitrate binding protein FerR (iron transport regulator)
LDEAADRVSFGDTIQPDPAHSRAYQQIFRNWEKARAQLLND